MEASVVGDLLPRDRRREQPAVVVPATDRAMSYHDLFTNAYKSGNVLRFLGVRKSATVAVAVTPAPEPFLAFLGAAQLGAVTTFEPTAESRVTLVPVAEEAAYDLPPSSKLAVYGGPPESPSTTHLEQEVWSENPGFPEPSVHPGSAVVCTDAETYGHRELLAAADDVVDALGIDSDSRLAIRVPLSTPAAVVGLVAGLLAEATTILVGPSEGAVGADAALVAAESAAPESQTVAIDSVSV